MNELFGIGRGYLLAFVSVFLTAVLTAIVLVKVPNTHTFLLNYWGEFLKWFVVPVIGAKELGKLGAGVFGGIFAKKEAPKKP